MSRICLPSRAPVAASVLDDICDSFVLKKHEIPLLYGRRGTGDRHGAFEQKRKKILLQ